MKLRLIHYAPPVFLMILFAELPAFADAIGPFDQFFGGITVLLSPLAVGPIGTFFVLLPFLCWTIWRNGARISAKGTITLVALIVAFFVTLNPWLLFPLLSPVIARMIWPFVPMTLFGLLLWAIAKNRRLVSAWLEVALFATLALLMHVYNFVNVRSFLARHIDGASPALYATTFAVLFLIVAGSKFLTGWLMTYRQRHELRALAICTGLGCAFLGVLFAAAFRFVDYRRAVAIAGAYGSVEAPSVFVGVMVAAVVLDCAVLDRVLSANRKHNCRLAMNMNAVLFFLLSFYMLAS